VRLKHAKLDSEKLIASKRNENSHTLLNVPSGDMTKVTVPFALFSGNATSSRIIFSPPFRLVSPFLNAEEAGKVLMKIERVSKEKRIWTNTWEAEDKIFIHLSNMVSKETLSKYFCFWTKDVDSPDNLHSSGFAHTFLPHKIIEGEYVARTAPYSGINLEDLLDTGPECTGCVTKEGSIRQKKFMFRMTEDHARRIIRHIARACIILRDNNVSHGDLALRNILINPSESELQEGVLCTSLPLVIDFGLGEVDAEGGDRITEDFLDLFTCCIHKFARESTCWLRHAIIAEDVQSAEVWITKLETQGDQITLENVEDLLA